MPNPYPWHFTDQLSRLEPGAVAVDLGSGGRSHPGVISLEWVEAPANTLRGDCLNLPFRDNCVDLILSQAVIEHVTDPQRAFDEMLRVLKPYGILYVEIAFMQPVHQEPHHYFNVTPYGLQYLLRNWDVEWAGTVGTANEVVDWIQRAYWGHSAPNYLKGRHSNRQPFPDSYALAASGVSALARKPV